MLTGNLPEFLKNRTCSFTGHRELGESFDREKLKEKIRQIIKKGYDVFLNGMAIGFDSECMEALLALKDEGEDIKICAVVPCADQPKNFSEEFKERYDYFLSRADYIVKEDRTYFKNCMLLRNNFLVDNSSLLLAYYDGRKKGGTYYTVNRAKKNGIDIDYFE